MDTVADLVDALAAGADEANPDGAWMHRLMARLYPIVRSITGQGVRDTLAVLGEHVPLTVHEVASGTQVFDWTVPDEWNVGEAYLADPGGRRVVDLRDQSLHLVSYSEPVRARMSLADLRPHLHSLPDRPDWIPYRTSYYTRAWGFCLADRVLKGLADGEYEVVIDSTLEPGSLTYGELVLPGSSDEVVLISAHVCHPSLANDNLSGIAIATRLARALAGVSSRRFTYRFVFAPGTIGSLVWLSRNPDVLPRIAHGLVLTGLGGPGPLVYKQTRRGDRDIDRAAAHVVSGQAGEVRPYSPYGYDERQYNAIGFDLPVGRLSRTPHGEYPEYHTSADDLSFVSPERLEDAYRAVLQILDVLESNARWENLSPYGEPQLGRRGLYPSVGGRAASDAVMAMLWVLAYSDGEHDLLEIADRSGVPFSALRRACADLASAGLLRAGNARVRSAGGASEGPGSASSPDRS